MAEDTNQAQDVPVTDTPDAPMPSADQQGSETSLGEVTAEAASTQTEEAGLPKEAAERTKREFEKLRSQLREERARRQYVESVFNQPAAPEGAQTETYADPNLHAIQQEALAAKQEALKTRQELQSYLDEQENNATYTKFPALNPDAKEFDKTLHVATRRVLLDSMLNPDDYGGQLTFLKAAELAAGMSPQQQQQLQEARTEGAKDAMNKLSPKEQAALEATSSPRGRTDITALQSEELRLRSRKGDIEAITARLRGIPTVGRE